MARGLEELVAAASRPPLETPLDHFYFLRHGQTLGNAQRIFQDPSDPLNDIGRSQALVAANVLRDVAFAHIVASSYDRARETAQTVADVTGKPLRLEPRLGERHFGELIGTSNVDLDWTCRPAGGETMEYFIARTRAGLADALVAGETPLVVAHGGTLRVLAAAVGLSLPDEATNNATPLLFRRDGARWAVALVASVPPAA